MERATKRQKTPLDEWSLKLEEKRLQNEELLSHFFSDEIRQLLLMEQEWVLDTDLLQGETCTEQIMAEGLMPCSVGLTQQTDVYHPHTPFVMNMGISSGLGSVSSPLRSSLSLKQMCLLMLLPRTTHNLFEQLYFLRGYFMEKMKQLPLHSEEHEKKVHSPFYASTPYPSRSNSTTTHGAYFRQPLFNSPLQLTTNAPLLKQAVDGVALSKTVMLLKLRILATYNTKGCNLDVCVLPLTPHEHSLLQKQPRLDGQLSTVLPYGCILYGASDTT